MITAKPAVFVARAEALGKADAEAAGEALHEAENEIDNDRRRPDGGESLRAKSAPNNDGVGQSIEKLKEITGNDREGKLQQHPKRSALCEILRHTPTSERKICASDNSTMPSHIQAVN